MGILLRELETGRYIFYLKGADSVLKNKVGRVAKSFLEEECENLAKEGLRTLVISQKYISEEEYTSWKAKMNQASLNLKIRELEEEEVIGMLESGMELLGITGVEDLLQDNIQSVIENLREAGIRVWMLTGDKLETAKCIAISTSLKAVGQQFFVLEESINYNLNTNTSLSTLNGS